MHGRLVALVALFWLCLAAAAQADTITPTKADDPVGPGDCPTDCSLRQALAFAQPGDTIQLLPTAYAVTQGTPLIVNKNVSIVGQGREVTSLDGLQNLDGTNQQIRIMRITGGTVQISRLGFGNGRDGHDEACQSACPTITTNGGGAIWNQGGSLSLDSVDFFDNTAPVGGAISSSGTLSLTDVDFRNNQAAFGGAVISRGTTTIVRSTFRDSPSGTAGGAVFVQNGTTSITNSTATGNGASNAIGGGVVNMGGNLALANVTLADNVRGALETDVGATTSARNTVIASGYTDFNNGACVAGNQNRSAYNTRTANPITQDLGGNVVEDATCGLTAAGDLHLAPTADNGGTTQTVALLHGSPALDIGAGCPAADQRGVIRPQGLACDSGAFEAVRVGAPTVSDPGATEQTSDGVSLAATFNLAGEAGELHFLWGDAPDALTHRTPGLGVGVAAQDTRKNERLEGLQPAHIYFYRAVAVNATGEAQSEVRSFVTSAGGPTVTNLTVSEVTDTTVKVNFRIDPAGADTDYEIVYNGTATDVATVTAAGGFKDITRTITGLTPGTDYELDVQAENASGLGTSDSGPAHFSTVRQVHGVAGATVELLDQGDTYACPRATIDWGDGSPSDGSGNVQCADDGHDGFAYTLVAHHAYPAAGHFHVVVDYSTGSRSEMYTVIDNPDGQQSLSVALTGIGAGHVSGSGINCPGVCAKTFDQGSSVTLTATPDAGSAFNGWSGGDCSGAATTCTVPIGTADHNVTAQFIRTPSKPAVSELQDGEVTDTEATVYFSVDPSGADTSYVIKYGTQQTQPVAIGSDYGPQSITETLHGLTPGTKYDIQVVATNSVGQATSPTLTVTTDRLLRGRPGIPVTLNATVSSATCPQGADVDWGEGDPPVHTTQFTCTAASGGGYDVAYSGTHTYAQSGRYHLLVAYDSGSFSEAWASISDDPVAPVVSDVRVTDATDTSATVAFSIDGQGSPTSYVLVFDGAPTASVDVGSGSGSFTHTFTGLKPGTPYQVAVRASNAGGTTTAAPVSAITRQLLTGISGGSVELTDTGTAASCPAATIDWGDGSALDAGGAITCSPANGGVSYKVVRTHAYMTTGRFHIVVTYTGGATSDAYAAIDPPPPPSGVEPQPFQPTPTPSPTPTPTPEPTPTFAKDVVVEPASGVVLVKLKGTNKFVPLKAGQTLPLGSEIDVTKGRITLTSVPTAGGKPETADFYGGIFVVTQSGGVTNLTLSAPLSCPKARGKAASAAAKQKTRRLWGSGKGHFRTSGRLSSATVRGTTWLVEDTCTTTLTQVKVGVVSVRDNVLHKTFTVRAGSKHVARRR